MTLKTPEQYIERNIETFTNRAGTGMAFGSSYVQRVCQIGYNQAIKTIEVMLERKLIDYAKGCEWRYVFRAPEQELKGD